MKRRLPSPARKSAAEADAARAASDTAAARVDVLKTRLSFTRITAPVDGQPVWSVTCFFIRPGSRGKGVATALLEAACAFAAANGARIVEGYPIDPLGERYANAFAWTGLMRVFERAGTVTRKSLEEATTARAKS